MLKQENLAGHPFISLKKLSLFLIKKLVEKLLINMFVFLKPETSIGLNVGAFASKKFIDKQKVKSFF